MEPIRPRRLLAAALTATVLLGPVACGGGTEPPRSGPSTATASSAPPAPPEKPAPGDHILALAGRPGGYELHAPPGYRPGQKLPLVVAVHYRGADPAMMRRMTRLDAKADAENFLVAYPCCGGNEDVGFIRAMVEHLVERWDADPSRVYATGMSAGATTSYRLAAEAPDLFAAVAPVSGGLLSGRRPETTERPARAVSVLSIIGADDRTADALEIRLGQWRREYGCTDGAPVWVDKGRTVNRTTSTCPGGMEIVGYTVNGMGHRWPGGAEVGLGDPGAALNATDVIWDFFAGHPKR
ncbi:PHB depolymerase family esterase [Micromonospora sp. NPDC126480]|uniref:alpha/beta hydrolase family esterase n=1 Tax=Micromonospora sp. NPDC126480 TaxID=3155312 RepID=UPI00332AC5D6